MIYFYPPKEEKISVRLEYAGDIVVSYPPYNPVLQGWNIKAFPDGKVINLADNQEYSYIFWEGKGKKSYDMSEGFVVEGSKTEQFLKEALRSMGFTPREYNEFIVYWYPRLMVNKYNLIHFAQTEYAQIAQMNITPKPDSLLRVLMVYQPLTQPMAVKPQVFKPFKRQGFTVVEWGGTEVTDNTLN
ncbi:MAG: hypothetical protein HQL13_01140 [Candidatus Omnitrophica bacterium]|nr:hypothetical protein [Candidatus Omnitrophota bacterium]